ncbi:TetR/AcrR family transcriptional regulator [Arthrobacter sp. NPDC090010]|uniref:TetR/AcrR family transcriptional regulator n=1 Tax=Arthrobacter sp. NPDC090010 TaxID=3363942 RepID=UPI0037F10D8E
MSPQRAPRTGKRGPYAKTAQTRQKIIDAAMNVFAARGYHAGSLQDVADVVGMSQTSLLHHFKRKSELLLAVLDQRDHSGVSRALGPMPFREMVLMQARANVDIAGLTQLYAVLSGESTTEGHPGRGYFAERFERLREEYAGELEDLRAQGRLRPGVDPAQAAASLIGLWDGMQLQRLYAPDSVDVAASLDAYLDLILLPE